MTDAKADGLTVITTHNNADFDALASMLAASLLYPGAVCVFPGSQEKSLRNFFVQSALYMMTLERAKNVDLDLVDRLVVVDTRQRDRIGRLADLLERDRPVEIHIYDHHPASHDDIKGDLEFIEEIGACTSMMTRMLLDQGVEIGADQATLLALGIYEDTGSFTFSSTTPADLLAGAELVRLGADLNTVSSLVIRELDAGQVGLLNEMLQNLQRMRISGVEVAIATCSTDSYLPDFAVVAHKLMDMENLNVLFALAQMENRVHLVARSRLDDVDVGRIAEAMGGGGHPSAASATIKNLTLVETRQRLGILLETHITPSRTAREIMSFPIISVAPEAPLSEAHDLLSRYSINVLLVMDDQELVGLISRQVVEKAFFLGVEDQPVQEYMNPEIVTIRPTATLTEIQYQIVGQRQRILPVIEADRVIGVVTRSDLLNILMKEPPIPDALYDSKQARNMVRQKDLTSLLAERLPEEIISLLKSMGRVADELQYNAYVVGGFVRDLLLRRSNLDIDIVIEGDGIRFANRFAREHGARVREHDKFGTAVVIMPSGFKVDVATARLEYYESPAALPIVELSSLKLDLYRRDFTINTLAVRINGRHFGLLIDYFGAQRDLKEKTIRLLHSLSLVEDPTRALRAIRFEQRFGFKIGKLTSNLIANAVRIGAFNRVNSARLQSELINMLNESNPARGLLRMEDFHLWRAIHQALVYGERQENLVHQVHLVLNWFDLLYLPERPLNWAVYLLALLDHLADKTVKIVLERLAVFERHQDLIFQSRHWSRRLLADLKKKPDRPPSEIYRLLSEAPLEGLLWSLAKSEEDASKRAVSLYFTELIRVKPMIDGYVLKKMGFRPGPVFRKILEAVRDARLNGQVKTVVDEKKFVAQHFVKGK